MQITVKLNEMINNNIASSIARPSEHLIVKFEVSVTGEC